MVTYFVWQCDNVRYFMDCINSHNLFGCVGLKQNDYCVFNKQYSKEQYEELVAKIIEHMQKTKEWGEYFPYELSPCCYNETVAKEYFPLNENAAKALGSSWKNEELNDEVVSEKIVPQDIREACYLKELY